MDPILLTTAIYGVYAALAATGLALGLRERWSSEEAKLRRALARAKVTPIKEAAGGVAKIIGRISASPPVLEAPLTGRKCVYWSVTLQRYELELLHVEQGTEFLVRDGTGKALVRAERLNVLATEDAFVRGGPFEPWQEPAIAFMKRYGASANQHYVAGQPMRFRELALCDGDAVSVSGAADWAMDPEPDLSAGVGYREPPRRLEIARKGTLAVTIGNPPPVVR